ncbi:TlpA family protein disulfide reductase [Chryseotalea sanaruensis]|uniref:TlpA family protein disulfide reductase n=1 Tax=Chryseotalea sanaruensis TaxID=2482724 RepID=A0A401UDL0_9BACT|nr:TlpA disulfide reductase family protein [Chryseotalea sanaruensis]GCC52987.1 TlpA family protein disulfide reductase [Chryseotalea sanaruensis]
MKKVIGLLKSISIPVLLILLLHLTGLLSTPTAYAQKILIQSGILNASVERQVTKENFSYDFKLQTLSGEPFDMGQLKGKVIFLNLWATWCGPCRAEMPAIESLYKGVAHEDLAFVMLSIDRKNDEIKVKNYVASKAFTFPVYLVQSPFPNNLPEVLQVPSIPTTFVINKKGEIVYKNVGTANYDTKKFKNFLQELLQE